MSSRQQRLNLSLVRGKRPISGVQNAIFIAQIETEARRDKSLL
jgi:hypothetical protein